MGLTVLIPQKGISPVAERYLLEKGYAVRHGDGCGEEDIARDVKGCSAILIRNAPITARILDAEPLLRVVGRHGVGVDAIDVAYAAKKGIWVVNAPLSNANAVAEHTLFLLLACAKKARLTDEAFRGGDFEIRTRTVNVELMGKTLGIVGFGRIGKLVAQKAALGLGMRIVAYDPFFLGNAGIEERAQDMETVFRRADFVSLHLPLTQATQGIIDESLLSLMKPTAYLINASRGKVVREADLVTALQRNAIAGAGLDVTESDPPDGNGPLFSMPQVTLTPHNAAHTDEAFEKMALHSAQGIHEVLSGHIPPTWPVNQPEQGSAARQSGKQGNDGNSLKTADKGRRAP